MKKVIKVLMLKDCKCFKGYKTVLDTSAKTKLGKTIKQVQSKYKNFFVWYYKDNDKVYIYIQSWADRMK